MSFNVVLRVEDNDKLSTLVALTKEFAEIISVNQNIETEKPKRSRYLGGKRNKGIAGADLVLKELRERQGGKASLEALRQAFQFAGFAKASLSPIISRLEKAGKIERNGDYVRVI